MAQASFSQMQVKIQTDLTLLMEYFDERKTHCDRQASCLFRVGQVLWCQRFV